MLVLEMPVCKKFYKSFTELTIHILKVGFLWNVFVSHHFPIHFFPRIYYQENDCLFKCTLLKQKVWSVGFFFLLCCHYLLFSIPLPWQTYLELSFICHSLLLVCLCALGEVRGQPQLLFSGCHLHYFLFCSGFFVCFSDLRYFTDWGLEVDWSSWPTSPRNLFTSLYSLITGITNSYHHTCLFVCFFKCGFRNSLHPCVLKHITNWSVSSVPPSLL